jgi:hypothetical protein
MSTRSAVVGRTFLALALGLSASACTESTTVPEPGTLDVRTSAASLESNGIASLVVTVELPPTLPRDASVEFTTTLGRWAIPGGTPDRKVTVRAQGGVAEARLFAAGDVGTAYITVSGGGRTAQTTVALTPALPSVADLFLDRTAAPADGVTAVTAIAILRREAGSVSRGTSVRFEVRDSTGAVLPMLGGTVLTDSAATARFLFTSTVPGRVMVSAHVGSVQSEARTVLFTPPPATPPAGSSATRTVVSGGISPLPLSEAR